MDDAESGYRHQHPAQDRVVCVGHDSLVTARDKEVRSDHQSALIGDPDRTGPAAGTSTGTQVLIRAAAAHCDPKEVAHWNHCSSLQSNENGH